MLVSGNVTGRAPRNTGQVPNDRRGIGLRRQLVHADDRHEQGVKGLRGIRPRPVRPWGCPHRGRSCKRRPRRAAVRRRNRCIRRTRRRRHSLLPHWPPRRRHRSRSGLGIAHEVVLDLDRARLGHGVSAVLGIALPNPRLAPVDDQPDHRDDDHEATGHNDQDLPRAASDETASRRPRLSERAVDAAPSTQLNSTGNRPSPVTVIGPTRALMIGVAAE